MLKWLSPEVFVKETHRYWKEAFSLSNGNVAPEFLNNVGKFLEIIMLRRLKQSTAADLEIPAKRELILHLPLTEEQKHLYLETITGCNGHVEIFSSNEDSSHALRTPPPSPSIESFTRSHSNTHDANSKGSGRSVTNMLMELRKVCLHPLLVDDMEYEDDDAETIIRKLVNTSAKFIALKKLLDHEVVQNNKKMLIFSGFDHALGYCQYLLNDMGISHLRLDGSTPHAMRKFDVYRFQNLDEYRVFVIATRAGGEGITLTAAEVVVFLDFDWNPQIMAQAEARAHRIGQTKSVTVVKMCTRGTLELQILDRVNKKLYLASKVISDAVVGTSIMSTAESSGSNDTFIRRLISRTFPSVFVNSFSADDLLDMNWGEIVRSCRAPDDAAEYEPASLITSPPSPGARSFNEQEKQWLSQSTRIKTGLFNGTVFKRRQAHLRDAFPESLDPSQRRLNKNRTVYVKDVDYYVDKESTFCVYGQAVPTLTKESISEVKAAEKIRFKHLNSCLICGKGRDLQECTYCPQVYHEGCISQNKNASKKTRLSNKVCAHHHCVKCNLTAINAGGLLLVCHQCPSSYCIDCVDLNAIKSLGENIPELEALGYDSPRHFQYITCGDCLKKAQERQQKRTAIRSDSQAPRSVKRTCRSVLG